MSKASKSPMPISQLQVLGTNHLGQTVVACPYCGAPCHFVGHVTFQPLAPNRETIECDSCGWQDEKFTEPTQFEILFWTRR
jgi:hypothetical protein